MMNKRAKFVTELHHEVAALIVQTLNLDISPEDIDPNAPLFGNHNGGLGLDSIDALELVLALSKEYGVTLKSDDAQRFNIFSNLNSLVNYIVANSKQQ